MGKQGLSRIFDELLRHLGGSQTPVLLRTYELSCGIPEAGEPPSGPYEDTELTPTPIVLDVNGSQADGLREVVAGYRDHLGLKKLVLHGTNPVKVGSHLYFEDSEWEVVRIKSPVIFGATPLMLVLARRLIT